MLKRIGRYLKGKPRLVWKYCWQAEVTVVDVTSDANWAGCRRGRKSTSGGTLMIGSHLIRTYSKTQSVIAKSSGESELYAVVRASTEGLGILTLLKDFGMHYAKVRLGMDASAAIGMAQRTGLNKVRHVEVDVLWIQDQVARRMLPISKIPGPQNPSDLCTKNVGVALVEQYMGQLHVKFAEGRAAVAQQLHSVVTSGRAFASRAVGDPRAGLARVVGGPRPVTSHTSSSRAPVPVAGRAPRRSAKSAEDRCVDSWAAAGVEGAWKRTHRTPRRAMFTPHRVAGGPGRDIKLMKTRTTTGKFVTSGEEFKIIDHYTEPKAAHMMLEHAWVGTTEFKELINDEGANINASTKWADWASDEEFVGFDAGISPATCWR